jgi:Mg2+-importing ATPase
MGATHAPAEGRRHSLQTWLSWLFGISVVTTVALVAGHFTEQRDFARLLERAQPQWLAAGFLLQVGTYLAEAGAFRSILARAGLKRPMGALVRLAFAKLFLDQAVPSGGLSGTLLVVNGLERRGVDRVTGTAAVLLDLRAFYAAYTVALLVALGLAWQSGHLTAPIAALSGVFLALAAAMSFLLTRWSSGKHVNHVERWRLLAPLFKAFEEAAPAVRRDGRLFARCVGFELAIVVLDALTVAAMLAAVGAPTHLAPVFVSFMLSSVARILGIVPGGLGTFEAASVASLRAAGVPVAAALAATLLFRGLSFWLPLLPGLVLARLELRRSALVSPSPPRERGSG